MRFGETTVTYVETIDGRAWIEVVRRKHIRQLESLGWLARLLLKWCEARHRRPRNAGMLIAGWCARREMLCPDCGGRVEIEAVVR